MKLNWGNLFAPYATVTWFPVAAQATLAWVFACVFVSFLRGGSTPAFFRAWTRAWYARAVALSIILSLLVVSLCQGRQLDFASSTGPELLGYSLYQIGKTLNTVWLLSGILLFAGLHPGRRYERLTLGLLGGLAALSGVLASSVEQILVCQGLLVLSASLLAAVILLRLPVERRSLGTRLSALGFGVQTILWIGYLVAFLIPERGFWPRDRTLWTVLASHNSYFDLVVDALLGCSLIIVMLQDAEQRRKEAESERAQLRVELAHSEKLRSLGTLVSGVAHELNNPLASILGFAEFLTAPVSGPARARAAEVIREQAMRCRRIVRGLGAFTGRSTQPLHRLDLPELLARVTRGFELELAGRDVTLELESGSDLPDMTGDRFALEQLFTNLIANAAQASPAGSRIFVRVDRQAESLCVRIEDQGPGIPPRVLAHAFDPFFTTKVQGEGTGLGLAVAHGIARSHGGSIHIENSPRGGALVSVTLPLAVALPESGELREVELPRPPLSGSPAEGLRLLVVEDEAMLCELIQRLGELRGWSVVTEVRGDAGLERLRSEGRTFDVVLCDLRMAPPSGIEIHDQLQREAPEILARCLFITGDLASSEAAEFVARCKRPILRKPFPLDDLVAAVERTPERAPSVPLQLSER